MIMDRQLPNGDWKQVITFLQYPLKIEAHVLADPTKILEKYPFYKDRDHDLIS